jgi:hypothetical protein
MEIEAKLKDPSSIRREGDKWVLELEELRIGAFSEGDLPIFEHLYGLGWKPDDDMMGKMFHCLPAKFVVKHEPRERWLQMFKEDLLRSEYLGSLKRFADFLTPEEKKALFDEFVQIQRKKEYRWMNSLYDYAEVLKLTEVFPEVFEFPHELESKISEDLNRADEWARRPLAYGYKTRDAEHFEECLKSLARFKELGLLPKEIEEQAKETVSRMIEVFERRARKSKNFGEVSRAALNLTEGETRARLIAAMILGENNMLKS